jgi:hypothetical protein
MPDELRPDEQEQTVKEPKPDIEANPGVDIGEADIRVDEQAGIGGPDIKPEENR